MTSKTICVIAALALSSAAAAKQQYHRISIPIPHGHVIKALAMNERNQVLVAECDTATVPQCTAFLWIPEKQGIRTILSYESGSYDRFLLNDLGQVAALRFQQSPSAANTVVLWSDWDGWHDVAQIPTSGAIHRLTNFGELLGTNERRIFYATRAFGLEYPRTALPADLPANFIVNDSNKHGILAGTLALASPLCAWNDGPNHAARWTPRIGVQDLETRNSPWDYCVDQSVGLATNIHGDVAGIRYGANSHDQHPTGFLDIGYLEGAPGASWSTYALDLNNRGEVVGRSGNHAFYWSEKTGIVDLGLASALEVNDQGLIRGSAETSSGSLPESYVWMMR